jgi:ribonuclease HII
MLKPRYSNDTKCEVGIDEAGRGCFWGPLVAGAVIWPTEDTWTEEIRMISSEIKDSKKLSAKRRAVMYKHIREMAVGWGLGVVEPYEIDEYGMSRANRLAFTRALENTTGILRPQRVIIDGILKIDTDLEQIVEPAADTVYLSVAAASILAKEYRDQLVLKACSDEPALEEKYSIGSSKGYGTERHREGILKHGVHEKHRQLFLRNLLGKGTCLIVD